MMCSLFTEAFSGWYLMHSIRIVSVIYLFLVSNTVSLIPDVIEDPVVFFDVVDHCSEERPVGEASASAAGLQKQHRVVRLLGETGGHRRAASPAAHCPPQGTGRHRSHTGQRPRTGGQNGATSQRDVRLSGESPVSLHTVCGRSQAITGLRSQIAG